MAKILIVDDSALIRKMLTSFLATLNYDISYADSGVMCFEKVSQDTFDCILLDLLMPDMDGFQVLEELNRRNINTPAIIISADIQETSRLRAINLGAFDFLNKPPRPQELHKAIQNALLSNSKRAEK